MLEAGAGRVMNVASVGAFMPGMPRMTPGWLVQTPRECAEEAWDAMDKGRRLVVTGWSTRLTTRVAPLLPATPAGLWD
ncbi:MAG TPA: hypothetical protein VJM11_02750, partial [Nevskiaceae bacterium]|nr:hypothetical protein [Nevskiaceae bacterium]